MFAHLGIYQARQLHGVRIGTNCGPSSILPMLDELLTIKPTRVGYLDAVDLMGLGGGAQRKYAEPVDVCMHVYACVRAWTALGSRAQPKDGDRVIV